MKWSYLAYCLWTPVHCVVNDYIWSVNYIDVHQTTSVYADTLTLYATATNLGGTEIARKSFFLGDVKRFSYLTSDAIKFDLPFSAPDTSNVSIIWTLVNSANSNHTFTEDLTQVSKDTSNIEANSAGILDGLGAATKNLAQAFSPKIIGFTIGSSFGPAGAIIGVLIGEAVNHILGSIIGSLLGCDCPIASDTVTFSQGDLSLLPITGSNNYSGGGANFDYLQSSYDVSWRLSKVNNTVSSEAALSSSTNFTVSILEPNTKAGGAYKLTVFDDGFRGDYASRYLWNIGAGTQELPDSNYYEILDTVTHIANGQAIGVGSYGSSFAIFSESFSLNETLNLQAGEFTAIPLDGSKIFLTGFYNQTYLAEAYIVDYMTQQVVRLSDAPITLTQDGVYFYTSAWAKPKIYAVQNNKITYYDLSSKQWSAVIPCNYIDNGRFMTAFEGKNTLWLGRGAIYGSQITSYGLSWTGPDLTSKIAALVFSESNPSKFTLKFHSVTTIPPPRGYTSIGTIGMAYDA